MANDRIFLVCKTCGDFLFLFKYYPGRQGYLVPESLEEIHTFMSEHLEHLSTDFDETQDAEVEVSRFAMMHLSGDPGFLLATEDDYLETLKRLGRDPVGVGPDFVLRKADPAPE